MESKSFIQKGYVQLLLTFILVGVLVALSAYAQLTFKEARGTYTGEATISISGEGEVMAVPDIGQFSFAVRAEGADAVDAQENSAEAINAILAYLEGAGVEEKDVKTQNYNLRPKYRYEERPCLTGGYCPPGERVIDGYEVSQNVTVKVRNLDEAGTLISNVGERGATNISSLQFTIDDIDVLQAQAREEAIADAKEKAQKLADELGMQLDRIVGFYEGGNNGYAQMERSVMAMDTAEGLGGKMTAPSIPVGENEILSNVTITYQLK
tara:strand:+ start:718 stop:1518 length:801 start_codon:yes stop_codon:yes gene_type:complete